MKRIIETLSVFFCGAITRLLLVLVAFAFAMQCAAQSPATASVDRSEVQVADPFRYTVSLTAPAGSKVTFPSVTETLGEFVVLGTNDLFDVPEQSGRRWARTIELETYESGELIIPAMQILVGQSAVATQPVTVIVQSQLDATSDPSKFRELKEIEEISPRRSATPWLVGLGAFLVAAAIGWYFTRKRTSTLSPEQWVSNQLDELQTSSGYHSKNPTIVLPHAADILREYIRRRFGMEAPRQTTDEFLSSLHRDPQLSQGHRQELKGFLQHVDKVKFSNLIPSQNEIDETISRVRQFVAQTTEVAGRASGQNSPSQQLASHDRVETS